jgi:hypothetical protein
MGENSIWEFCLNADFHVPFRDLLHAANLRHGTAGFTSHPKEGVLGIFSAGFEPSNVGTRGQHASSRTPKPLKNVVNKIIRFYVSSEHFTYIVILVNRNILGAY